MSQTAAKRAKRPRARKLTAADLSQVAERAPAERWQRGAEYDTLPLEHRGRRVQRVLSGLLQLEKGGRVGQAEMAAGLRWRRDYELGVMGGRSPDARSGAGDVRLLLIEGSVDAMTRYRQACQDVGMLGDAMLRAYVAEGLSLRQIHVRLPPGTDREALGEVLVATLERLALHYAEVDRLTRTGILPRRGEPGTRDEAALARLREGAPA